MSDPEKTLTFVEHLEELRTRLVISILGWFVATLIAFPLAPKAIALLTRPLTQATTTQGAPRIVFDLTSLSSKDGETYAVTAWLENLTSETKRLDQIQVDIALPGGGVRPIGEGSVTGSNVYYRNLTDPIFLIFKTALVLGLILTIPIWTYQIWAFVRPGLKPGEIRVVRPLFGLCAVLFPCGVVFAYFLLQLVIGFLLSIQIANLAPLLDYPLYVKFALRIMVGFGIVFELPVVILLLARLGVVTPMMLRQHRGMAIVIIAIVSILFTPTDPVSMVAMMVPLAVLYELSIWLSYTAGRAREKDWE
jgi:sec-independent protein translocase protein TatC